MKKILLSILSVMTLSLTTNAQSYMEGFEGTANLPTGWDTINRSGPTPGVAPAWYSSSLLSAPPAALEGTDYYISNYQAVGGTGTISSWLFTVLRTMKNGDVLNFYTETLGDGTYPDRLEVRMSTNGTSTNVGTTSTSVGDYSVTLGVINASLTSTGYPTTWTKYSYTLSGLPGTGVSGRFAFRYFVTNGGPSGANSDAIAIDSVYYKPTVASGISSATNNGNFRIFPNPTSGAVKITFPTSSNDRMVIVQNMIGEVLFKEAVGNLENTLDLSSFAKGIYLINIKENNVIRTEKLTVE